MPLTRIADLSKKVLTLPKTSVVSEPTPGARWGLMAGGAALAVLVVAAWYAGRESGALDGQRLRADLNHLTEQMASTQLRLTQQTAKNNQLEKRLQSFGKSAVPDQLAVIERRLQQAEAQADQYKAIFDREHQTAADNTRLMGTLSNPGAHLFVMKGSDVAADTTAYALFIENSRLLFVGSNLPKPADGRQFQLWVVRKQEPKIVSAGVFSPDDDNRAVISFDEASVLSDVSLFRVTDEPEGGSPAPTGPKLLEGILAEE